MFERGKTTLDDYFVNRTVADVVNKDNINLRRESTGDFNTSRHLQDEKDIQALPNEDIKNQLKLRENNLNDITNMDIDKTAEKGKNNVNDVQIHNNFVKKNASIDMAHQNFGIINSDVNNIMAPQNITKITMRDYEALTIAERLQYDNRSLSEYIQNNLVRTNLLISIFAKHSIIDPIHIRVTKLIFLLSLIFGINAFLFTDRYIDKRAESYNKVILF
jgi:hypothetical protein